MEVILIHDVKGLGAAGKVVRVKDGYARNYLFPKKLAVLSDTISLKNLEIEQQRKNLQRRRMKEEAGELKEKLESMSFTIPVLTQGKEKIYGSITAVELIKLLKEENIDLERDSIVLEEPIKALGIYEVPVRLHPEVTATIKVWVVKK